MFEPIYTSSDVRAPGALEVAIRARESEKKLALMVAEIKAWQSEKRREEIPARRGLLARALASLNLF